MKLRGLGLLAVLAVSAGGCRGPLPCWPNWDWSGRCAAGVCCTRPGLLPYFRWIDECQARHLARRAARRELRRISEVCRPSCDFRAGFEQAFVDVALGAEGNVPVFPPREYWKDKNRTAEGHQRAGQWFAGYAAGAGHALACRAEFNVVPSSVAVSP